VHYRPGFSTDLASHVSGRESRRATMSVPLWEIEFAFDLLRMDAAADFQALASFYMERQGQDGFFIVPVPTQLAATLGASALTCRFADDSEDLEEFMTRLWTLQSLKLRTVKA